MVKWLPYHNDHSHIAMSPLPYHNHHSTFIVSPYCQITITIPQSLIAIFYVSISPLSYCCIAVSLYCPITIDRHQHITLLPYHHCHMAIPYCHITITIGCSDNMQPHQLPLDSVSWRLYLIKPQSSHIIQRFASYLFILLDAFIAGFQAPLFSTARNLTPDVHGS